MSVRNLFVTRLYEADVGADLLEELNRLVGGALQIVPGVFDENLAKTKTGELVTIMENGEFVL